LPNVTKLLGAQAAIGVELASGSEAITNGKYSERPTFNPVKFLIVP